VPRRTWGFRVEDILAAIDAVRGYTADMDFDDFQGNDAR